jgi:hypothetical protein
MGVTAFNPAPATCGGQRDRRQEQDMATKHDRTAIIFAMAATILAIMTWAAFPNESDLVAPVPPKQTLYRTDWSVPHCLRTGRGLWEARLSVFSK